MTAIVVVVSLTLALSFLCSIIEAALYTVTPSQLEVLKKRKVFGARRFARYRENVEGPIAAILAVNTIAHTAGASVAGALVADRYGDPVVGVFAALFTLAVLVWTEIVPKSIGVRYAQQLVPFLVWPLQALIWLSWPIAHPTQLLMRRLMKGKGGNGPTEDEIIAMSRMAAQDGELTRLEQSWVENALCLDKVSAHDLMTPRTVVQSLPVERKVAEVIADRAAGLRHSRLPVYENGDPDRLVGVVLRRDVYDAFAQGRGDLSLRQLLRPLDYVPEGMKGPHLLQKFIGGKRHLVAVIDEYGGFEGIVTLEDVLEHLIGQEI